MQQKSDAAFSGKALDFVATLNAIVRNVLKIFALEYELARQSVAKLIQYTLALAVFVLGTWIMLLLLITFLLHLFVGGWIVPLAIVALINLLLTGIVTWRIRKYLKNMQFSYTRKQVFPITPPGDCA